MGRKTVLQNHPKWMKKTTKKKLLGAPPPRYAKRNVTLHGPNRAKNITHTQESGTVIQMRLKQDL